MFPNGTWENARPSRYSPSGVPTSAWGKGVRFPTGWWVGELDVLTTDAWASRSPRGTSPRGPPLAGGVREYASPLGRGAES